ncbi:MAG: benzoate/H(+) symporter BenE family transporter [Solirubrobacteraceae bacterium]
MSVADPTTAAGRSQPVVAGVIAAIVGFMGAFAVVLAGLRAVGATEDQAASGLLAVSVAMGVASIGLSVRTRMPILVAWSTPGAALLISTGAQDGGWPAAIGAFLVCGVLLALAGLSRPLARLIAAIPSPIASAMLAGVLLTVCLAPARAAADSPAQALPVIAAWLLLWRFAPRWAVPGALMALAGVMIVEGASLDGRLAPTVDLTAPVFDFSAIVGLALPLFLVTMASQNVTGMAVLQSFGYRPDLRPILLTTGAGTALIAPMGGHAINLAAITQALASGPDAGPDRSRRWIAAVTAGAAVIVLGLGSGLAASVASAAPPGLIEAVAGLALLGALTASLAVALADTPDRDAAVVTLVVAASAITIGGISAPFWGLVAGLGVRGLRRWRADPPPSQGHEPTV